MTARWSARWARVRWRTWAALATILLAMGMTLAAAQLHRMVIGDIDGQWRQSTRDLALRSRAALLDVARGIMAAGQGAANANGDDVRCAAALRQAITANEAIDAIRVELDGGRACTDAKAAGFADLLPAIGGKQEAQSAVELAPDLSLSADAISAQGLNLMAVRVVAADRKWTAVAVIDPAELARATDLEPAYGGDAALMARGGQVLAMAAAAPTDAKWLPAKALPIGSDYHVATARSQSGADFSYATQAILGSDLYILRRFSDAAKHAARLRSLWLAIAPILLAALCFAYARAMQFELLRAIGAILAAMRTMSADGAVGQATDVETPKELREFVAGYNEMAREAGARARSLRMSLAENEFLLRELNHRVKSSLQIIQSYVSLTRRIDRESGRQTSAAAIEARVQVLSTAYRKAFSEGRMRDVRIRQFAEDIVANLLQLFEWSGLAIELNADVSAALVIDRAIPLGLAIVESLIAGMSADGAHMVAVRIDQLEELRVEIRIWTDGALRKGEPNAKLLAGLALQLAAIVDEPGPGTVLHWRFQGRPPPVILSRAEPPQLA